MGRRGRRGFIGRVVALSGLLAPLALYLRGHVMQESIQ